VDVYLPGGGDYRGAVLLNGRRSQAISVRCDDSPARTRSNCRYSDALKLAPKRMRDEQETLLEAVSRGRSAARRPPGAGRLTNDPPKPLARFRIDFIGRWRRETGCL